jgi:hypothetical protein
VAEGAIRDPFFEAFDGQGELFAPDRWSGFFVSWEIQTAFSTG